MDVSSFIEGEYLTANAVKVSGSDIASIIGEFVINTGTPFNKDTLEGEVELSDGMVKKWCMNNTTARKIIASWGSDSKKWIGKRVKFEITKVSVGGRLRDAIFAEPLNE